jgi:PSMD12/CSN4, N-terminal
MQWKTFFCSKSRPVTCVFSRVKVLQCSFLHSTQASDLKSTTRLAETLLTLAHEARRYNVLKTNLTLLSKKHGQLKGVVQTLVELTITWLEEIRGTEGTETWLEFVHALREVTEGKVCCFIKKRHNRWCGWLTAS